MDIFGLYKGCVDPIHLKDTVDELTKYDIGQKVCWLFWKTFTT